MKIAIIGSDFSALLCAWLLRNTAEVVIIQEDNTLQGYSPSFRSNDLTSLADIDHNLFVYDSRISASTIKLLQHLGLSSHKLDLKYDFALEGNRNLVSGRCLLPVDSVWYKNIFRQLSEWQRLITLPKSLSTFQSGFADACLSQFLGSAYFVSNNGSSALNIDDSAMQTSSRQNFALEQRLSPMQHWHGLTLGSNGLMRKLTQQASACTLFSSKIARFCYKSKSRTNIQLQFTHGSNLNVDHVIFADASQYSHSIIDKHVGFDIFNNIAYRKHSSILHSWPGIICPQGTCANNMHYHHWQQQSHLGVSYKINNLQNLNSNKPLFLSHNTLFEIPASFIIDKACFYLPVNNSLTRTKQQQLARLQGMHNIWFTGSGCANADIESRVLQATQICHDLGANVDYLVS